MGEDLAENLVVHRRLGLAPHVIAELRFDHMHGGLDVRPLVIVGEELRANLPNQNERFGLGDSGSVRFRYSTRSAVRTTASLRSVAADPWVHSLNSGIHHTVSDDYRKPCLQRPLSNTIVGIGPQQQPILRMVTFLAGARTGSDACPQDRVDSESGTTRTQD